MNFSKTVVFRRQCSFSPLNSASTNDKNLMRTAFLLLENVWIREVRSSEESYWVWEWLSLTQKWFRRFWPSVGYVLFFLLMGSEGGQTGQNQMRHGKALFVCCGLLLIGAKELLTTTPMCKKHTHAHTHAHSK